MLYRSDMLVCPHKIQNKTRTWTLRICGLLFLYIGFSFGSVDTLRDTALVKSISLFYPNWQSFLVDVILTILFLGILSPSIHALLLYEKSHKASKQIQKITKWLDILAIRNFLEMLSVLTRWSMAFVISFFIMSVLQNIKLGIVPSFATQPIVYSIAVLGLIFCIESFAFWQIRLHRLFCIQIK